MGLAKGGEGMYNEYAAGHSISAEGTGPVLAYFRGPPADSC